MRAYGYGGNATKWDRIESDGDLDKPNYEARFLQGDEALAVATLVRYLESLKAEPPWGRQSA